MRSSNPSLTAKTFEKYRDLSKGNKMTIEGTVNKTLVLLFLLVVSAFFAWTKFPDTMLGTGIIIGMLVLSLVIALVAIYKPKTSPITAPLYAVVEGVLVGVISKMYEAQYDGIVIQAVLITISIFLALLFAYKSRLIKVTENFKLGVFAATFGVLIVYLLTFVLSFFGTTIPYIHENGMIGILFSVAVIIIAALNLVLDFDFIEQGASHNVPKYMEWYAGFGLLVTLVWLYFEILNLLRKIMSRD